MKPDAWKLLAAHRITSGPCGSEDKLRNNGAFQIPARGGEVLNVIASDGEGWDHVSVSLVGRCPTWNEMAYIKSLFFEPDEVVMQLHPAASEYVNYHEHCLHLWKPQGRRIPTPPAHFVGPR